MQYPPDDAKKWVKNQFARLFSSLQEDPVQPTSISPNIAELIERLLPLQAGFLAPCRKYGEEKKIQ